MKVTRVPAEIIPVLEKKQEDIPVGTVFTCAPRYLPDSRYFLCMYGNVIVDLENPRHTWTGGGLMGLTFPAYQELDAELLVSIKGAK